MPGMRLSFPHGEHSDVKVGSGSLCIGSGREATVSLSGHALRPQHAWIDINPSRGLLLRVAEGANGVHVNGRPVSRFAFVRLGDTVSLGAVQILLQPERDDMISDHIPEKAPEPGSVTHNIAASRVVLRGVGGSHFGKSFPLAEPLTVGRGDRAGLRIDEPALGETHCRFEHHGDFVALRDLGSEEGSLVNGLPVHNARLHPGDQVVIEQQRFVLEAPGLPPRGAESYASHPGAQVGTTQTMRPVTDDMLADARRNRKARPEQEQQHGGGMLWLIAAAVLIATGLAALLLYAPGWLD